MPDTNSPLSMDGALALMRESRETPQADNTAAAATPAATAGDSPPEKDEQNTGTPEPEAAAVEGAEANAPTDGEKAEGDAETGDALPSIEAPSSWKTEEKAVWESLPRAAQEAISRREQDRTTELRNLQNRSADAQKAADAEVNKLKGLADKITTHVDNEVAAIARDFPELKSESDVAALADRDPARFAKFQARLMQFQSSRQAQAEAQQALAQKADQQQQEFLTSAKTALLGAFPEWKDTAVAQREMTALQDYAISLGVPEQAARTTLDPFVYKLAQKAMAYDKAQKAKADALKREPPRAVKPGMQSANPRADAKAADRQTRLDRLGESGAIEDARGLLRL